MTAAATEIAFILSNILFAVFMIAMCICIKPDRENADAQASPVPRIVKKKLRYFPYSTVGRRASEKLVCAICLETLLHGEMCGEVPACRHFLHQLCVDEWMKSRSSCPLCRTYIATGSSEQRVSDGDDRV